MIPPRRGTLSRNSQAAPSAVAPRAASDTAEKAGASEVIYEDGEATDKTAGKSRAGQQPDHAGFLKKRGDQGRIKLWRKRHFRLYRKEGVIAYFKNETDTEQLGEVSVTGAFLVDKREDIGKFAFTITMKTSARVWVLQANDEATMNQWISLCTPLMKETAAVRPPPQNGKKPLKPLPGLPLPFPPTYVQGFAEREYSASIQQDGELDWTKLSHVPVTPAAVEPGQVAITLHGKTAQVEEIRLIKPDAHGEAIIENVPKQLKYNMDTVGFTSTELTLHQVQYAGDEKTQRDLLRKLVGRKITCSVPGTGAGHDEDQTLRQETRQKPGHVHHAHGGGLAFPHDATFTGKLFYDAKDDRYALVDESTNAVHFLQTRDARTIKLVDANVSKLNAGTADAFVAPRLVAKFGAGASQSVGRLRYELEDGFDTHINYVLTLSSDEKKADIQGWYSVENKTSKTFENATLVVAPEPKAPPKDDAPVKEDGVEEVAAEEGKKKAESKGFGGLMAIAGALFKGGKSDEPAPLKKYNYAVAQRVTLPSYDWAHAAFLSQQVPVTVEHLVRFETPAYTIKPQVAKEAGVDAKPVVSTVVRFVNPLKEALPTGGAAVSRINRNGLGAIKLADSRLGRVEGGEQVSVTLEKTFGISATRVQTGYNFDPEKHFVIETIEITVANSRNETVNLVVEESFFRWNNFEIPASKPVHTIVPGTRKISWNVRLNHGEDQTIKYTAFYSTFDLESDYEPR